MTVLSMNTRHWIEDTLEGELEPFSDSLELAVEDSRIMVVDDDDRVAILMARLLERDGFRHIVTVADGQQAVDTEFNRPPDVVVLDVHIPRLDGFEVLREIVRHDGEVGRVTGVIAVSGDASPNTCQDRPPDPGAAPGARLRAAPRRRAPRRIAPLPQLSVSPRFIACAASSDRVETPSLAKT